MYYIIIEELINPNFDSTELCAYCCLDNIKLKLAFKNRTIYEKINIIKS